MRGRILFLLNPLRIVSPIIRVSTKFPEVHLENMRLSQGDVTVRDILHPKRSEVELR